MMQIAIKVQLLVDGENRWMKLCQFSIGHTLNELFKVLANLFGKYFVLFLSHLYLFIGLMIFMPIPMATPYFGLSTDKTVTDPPFVLGGDVGNVLTRLICGFLSHIKVRINITKHDKT
jgi:hypothetical protein